MSSSVGIITFPIYGKSHVPNHQPDPMVFLWFSFGCPMVVLWFSYGFPMVSMICAKAPGKHCEHIVMGMDGVKSFPLLGPSPAWALVMPEVALQNDTLVQ